MFLLFYYYVDSLTWMYPDSLFIYQECLTELVLKWKGSPHNPVCEGKRKRKVKLQEKAEVKSPKKPSVKKVKSNKEKKKNANVVLLSSSEDVSSTRSVIGTTVIGPGTEYLDVLVNRAILADDFTSIYMSELRNTMSSALGFSYTLGKERNVKKKCQCTAVAPLLGLGLGLQVPIL